VRITLIVAAVLLVLALVGDRVAAHAAQSAVATRMQSELQLPDKPTVRVHAHLQGLHVPFSDLTGGRIDEVPVDHVQGTVTVPYDEIARAVRLPGLSVTGSGDSVQVAGRVTALGQTFTASAHARLEVRNGTVVVTADHARVVGVQLPAAVLPVVERGLSFTVPVQKLPFGLRLTGVQADPDELRVSAEADHVVLRREELTGTG
jgi:hypothetical protein